MPSETARFTEVHAKDGSTVEHRRICPREDKEMPYEQIVNGFEALAGSRRACRGRDGALAVVRIAQLRLVTVLERRPD